MTTSKRKKKIKELKDAESRQFFYEEHIESGLPIQLRELRKKRKLTQKELAELTGFDQSNISEWENPNYEYTPQIGTLKRFANAFDVPLIVRFGSWSELLEWDDNLSSAKIAPESFDEFVEQAEKEIPKEEFKETEQESEEISNASKVETNLKRPFKLVRPNNPSLAINTVPELPFQNIELVWSAREIVTVKNEPVTTAENDEDNFTAKRYMVAGQTR